MTRSRKRWVRCVLLVVLLGSLWRLTMHPGDKLILLRQDVATMLTLHQLHSVYPEARRFLVEYYDDGWVLLEIVLPHEMENRIAHQIEPRNACGASVPEGDLLVTRRAGAGLNVND